MMYVRMFLETVSLVTECIFSAGFRTFLYQSTMMLQNQPWQNSVNNNDVCVTLSVILMSMVIIVMFKITEMMSLRSQRKYFSPRYYICKEPKTYYNCFSVIHCSRVIMYTISSI